MMMLLDLLCIFGWVQVKVSAFLNDYYHNKDVK